MNQYQDFNLRYKKKRKRPKSKKPFFALFFSVVFFIITIIIRANKNTTEVTSPLGKDETREKKSFNLLGHFSSQNKEESNVKSENELLKNIKKLLEEKQGFYSVYIYNLNKNQGFGINETTMLRGASLNKVPILASLYYLAQEGTIDLDDRITLQAKDIQDFGTGILRNEGPGSVYSLKTLASIMIKHSDNTAGYVLGENIIGFDTINELMRVWGLKQTDMKDNKISNYDLAILFTKMYRGHITNAALTPEMMGFFIDTDFENRLPRHLPDDVKVYHKIGNETGNIHDVGIVELTNNPYYIGILTNDIIDIQTAENTISEISKMVYEFYTQE